MRQCGQFPLATQLLGDAYLKAGRADDAVRSWQATANLRPSPDAHRRLAEHFEQSGDDAAAGRQRALMHQALGVAKLRSSNPAAALDDLEQAVTLDPSLALAWFYVGECRRFTDDLGGARLAYQRVLELNPNHGRAVAALELLSP
jgi:tetratricopeptide (TPR) repeat protein